MLNYSIVEKMLCYEYKNINLLIQAFTHSSYANENNTLSYERLEFLGDSILDFYVTDYIFKNYDLDEGELSKMRAKVVSAENLSEIFYKYKFDEFVLIGNSIKKSISKNICADIIESIIASIYLDGGQQYVAKWILDNIIISNENIENVIHLLTDYKTMLQEKLQPKKAIEYKLVNQSGLSPNTLFTVELYVNKQCVSTAVGINIKSAEQLCARQYLEKFQR